MKANQKFMEADNAVSPVIGVILMVAITVVLAAVVFVLVSDLGSTEDSAPNISFTKQASQDRLQVVSADPDADWSDIRFTVSSGDCGTPVARLNSGTEAAITVGGAGMTATDGTSVSAGDYIEVQPTGGCSFTLTHVPTNSLIGTWDFS